jgi:hypothetical protein
MAVVDIHSSHRAAQRLPRPIELVAFALVVAHVIYLAACYVEGSWLIGPDGKGIASDFVNVWAAGKFVLQSTPSLAYDWPAHKAMEEVAVGHAFNGYFGWHYPPMFLFAAAVLALMPYAAAYALWVFVTFPAYLVTVRAIIGERSGYLLAAGFPAVLSNFVVGQNGFLTASLLGGTLYFLPVRPILAGCLLGVMTYKPHFGLLFPLVLAASGAWRTFIAAGVVATLLAAISWLAFGSETWIAFVWSVPHTSQAFLSDGWADWAKLQTLFGLARTIGAGETVAWTLHIAFALALAAAVTMIWRGDDAYELKAAALATAAMLATPYLYTYDLVVLAVPLAFLFRLGRTAGFLRFELGGIALACALIVSFPFVTAPVGFAAVLVIAALIARRLLVTPQLQTA